jgi:hypothetical protein
VIAIVIELRDEHKLHHHLLDSRSYLAEVVVLVAVLLGEVLTSLDAGHKRRRLLGLLTLPDGGRRRHLPLGLLTSRLA